MAAHSKSSIPENLHISKMSGAGRDSQYKGGEFLRWVDKSFQAMGMKRDSWPMRKMHELEHLRRAGIAEREGDLKRAEAERERARNQHTENYHPPS